MQIRQLFFFFVSATTTVKLKEMSVFFEFCSANHLNVLTFDRVSTSAAKVLIAFRSSSHLARGDEFYPFGEARNVIMLSRTECFGP